MKSSELLAKVYRGNYVESYHLGVIYAVDSKGKVLYQKGDATQLFFPRSSCKMFQATALVASGALEKYKLPEHYLALACASHLGEVLHQQTVDEWLKHLNLKQEQLLCGAAYPQRKNDLIDVVKQGIPQRSVYHNCSGKHIGILTACLMNQWDLQNYADLEHSVQKEWQAWFSEFLGYDASKIDYAIDGCTLPTPYLKMQDFALALARFAKPDSLSTKAQGMARQISHAIGKYPTYVAGTKTLVEALPQATNGRLLCKNGAEAVYAAWEQESGVGILIKIADGSTRALDLVLVNVLKTLDLLQHDEIQRLEEFLQYSITNSQSQKVGHLEVVC